MKIIEHYKDFKWSQVIVCVGCSSKLEVEDSDLFLIENLKYVRFKCLACDHLGYMKREDIPDWLYKKLLSKKDMRDK